ncbi:MAG: amino acid adenylation domain-containing protein, partial [Aestuariibacter sp.]|nr:amino acid adenylation domain-containing protein [Aestuariibacter sp.]
KAKVVCLDSEWEQIEACSGENPARQSGLEDLAYVIYTSGSTGVPKGAMNLHQGIYNRLLWMQDAYKLTAADNVLQKTPFGFDVSVWEFFWPLLAGARLTIAKPGGHKEGDYLIKLTEQEQITTLHFVPSMLQVFLQEPILKNCHSLKRVICSGEALPVELESHLFTSLPAVELHNLYGPTEAAVDVTYWACQRGNPLNFVPIGSPIANTHIYLLDANKNPTPPGIPGELCIAGAGLARGYLNRPELTAQKFIEIEIFGKRERVYKTGDLARWLPDGSLEFLGRLDHQVKLRGFRIELGEIETILSQHEAVKEAVVLVYSREENPGLVAYVTLAMPIDEEAGILRTWLKSRLPEYMVPGNFTVLEQMPLTPNGKIDRKAMPAPDLSMHTEHQSPRTETEHLLCNLWSKVLGIEVTSINSHFIESGGHSLLATQLVSRIRESFGIEMPLRVVFEKALLREQAEWLDKQQSGSELPPIVPSEDGESLVLSFAQQRLWFLVQLEGQSATYNMPATLRIEGELNETALHHALSALIKRHDSLRLCFPMVDGETTVELNDAYNPLSITDLSGLTESEQQRQVTKWIVDHTKTHFELSVGHLLNLRLLKLNKEEQILLFN